MISKLKRPLETWVTQHWYQLYPSLLSIILLPFSGVMWLIISLRRLAYQRGWLTSYRSRVPVIVVGNVTVGGSGKTPLVMACVRHLQKQHHKVGVIARGYGGRVGRTPHLVSNEDAPDYVGDEPLMVKRLMNCEVCVGKDRAASARCLENKGCDVIISDDGLQHYALQRDIEIGMIDGVRQFGNRLLLPAGPLREMGRRLQQLDFQVTTWSQLPVEQTGYITMVLNPSCLVPLDARQGRLEPQALNIMPVHAVTAIGHPQRFFNSLRLLGYQVIEHAYPDHAQLTSQHLQFDDEYPVIMTAKDAVKCDTMSGVN